MKISSLLGITSFVACTMYFINHCHGTPFSREAASFDKCLPLNGRSKRDMRCPTNLKLVFYFNTIICDCPNFSTYFLETNSCYEVYRQGPCPEKHYVYMGLNDTKPSCTKNPCKEDGQVLYNDTCYKLYSIEPCSPGYFIGIEPNGFEIKCVPWDTSYAIINFYVETCPRGSLRDRCGLCRKPLPNDGK